MIRLGKGVTLSNEEVEVLKELLGKISLEVNIDCQNVQNSFPIQPNKPLGDRQKPFKVLSMRLIKPSLLPLIGYAFNCKLFSPNTIRLNKCLKTPIQSLLSLFGISILTV